ncbi:peroxiredoxin family protein [Bacillus arachidis]|uniref:Redoxin domain-containing protein n=1 Tax=Bacillus arachidis TaxID=2819290 RepID=A0ABS3P5B9_9BACI|nr:redoxin domain-containing protein [Bacillus arachidis]MBO1628371.1 redoxin domain-containing protein [Bacillus arachidis]
MSTFILFTLVIVIYVYTYKLLTKLHSNLHKMVVSKQSSSDSRGLPINSIAPNFSLESITGHIVKLEDLCDKPVILLISADGCEACSLDVIEFTEEARRYEDKYNFVLIIATPDPTTLNTTTFEEQENLKVLLATMDFIKEYNITLFPTFLFLDERGTVLGLPFMVNQFGKYYKLLNNSTITA